MAYDPQKVAEHYNQAGIEEWERFENSPFGRLKYYIHLQFIERYLPQDGLVLDAGCGPGRFAIDLAKLSARVVLADISDVQLRIAREKIEEAGVEGQIEGYYRLDICDLSSFEDHKFDMTLCYGGALSYVCQNYRTAVSELVRVTKPTSPLLISVMSLYGTLRLGMVLDADSVFSDMSLHLQWDGREEIPDFMCTNPNSREFHQPMGLYTSKFLRELLEEEGCQVIELAAANATTAGLRAGLNKISENDNAWETVLSIEKQACTVPGLIDTGEHLIAVAFTSPKRILGKVP